MSGAVLLRYSGIYCSYAARTAETVKEDSLAQIVEKIRMLEEGWPISGMIDRLRGY